MQTHSPFKALRILHTALMAGLALFLIVSYVLTSQGLLTYEEDKTMEVIFQGLAAVLSITCLLIGFRIFKKQLLTARNISEPAEKRFEMYRGACIVWWAMLEGPGLFAAVAYLKTGDLVFIVLGLFHLGLLFVFTPRRDNIILLLNLTSEDVQKLESN